MTSFGKFMRHLRKHFRLSQGQVAADIGVTHSTMSHVETSGFLGRELLSRLAVYYQYDYKMLEREMVKMNGSKPGTCGSKIGAIPEGAPKTASERIKRNYAKGVKNANDRERNHQD